MRPRTAADVISQLDVSVLSGVQPLYLRVGMVSLSVHAAPDMRETLATYFAEALSDTREAGIVVQVLEGQTLTSEIDWIDWTRDAGKTGRKDAIYELEDARLIHKRRTGMTFLQSSQDIIAFGPCAANTSQIINFVNTQILNVCHQRGWVICHAAAVTNTVRGLAISGLSGGGKSTSVLRIMDIPKTSFVTNDRLLVQAATPYPRALGIPKQPRINPGTILNNPRLSGMLDADTKARLAALSPDELWHLEEKYDLFISQVYGPGRVQYATPLTDFWVLNWSRMSEEPTRITPVDLTNRPDLLPAIMKNAGPFYQGPGGVFRKDGDPVHAPSYLAALHGVSVSEVTGKIDFDVLKLAASDLLDPVSASA